MRERIEREKDEGKKRKKQGIWGGLVVDLDGSSSDNRKWKQGGNEKR